MEIKDNELLRQFEIITETGLVAIEYSVQERKLFLTKFFTLYQILKTLST